MASRLIDEDPALAHEHAVAASRRAGRIAIVRETLASPRMPRRTSPSLCASCAPTAASRQGRSDRSDGRQRARHRSFRPCSRDRTSRRSLRARQPVRVALAIAMSGARLDQGDLELALGELEIPELDPDRAFEWSPALFAARAAVLEDLGRTDEAEFWGSSRRGGRRGAGRRRSRRRGDLHRRQPHRRRVPGRRGRRTGCRPAATSDDLAPEGAEEESDVEEESASDDDDASAEADPTVEDEVRELLGEDEDEDSDPEA